MKLINKIEHATKRLSQLSLAYPPNMSFDLLFEQLKYLSDYLNQKPVNLCLINNISIGSIAVRDIDNIDRELCNILCEIQIEIESLPKEYDLRQYHDKTILIPTKTTQPLFGILKEEDDKLFLSYGGSILNASSKKIGSFPPQKLRLQNKLIEKIKKSESNDCDFYFDGLISDISDITH